MKAWPLPCPTTTQRSQNPQNMLSRHGTSQWWMEFTQPQIHTVSPVAAEHFKCCYHHGLTATFAKEPHQQATAAACHCLLAPDVF